MSETRTGLGVDSHRLVAGRPLILGGVEFESEIGLDGHSDADVLTHAVIDALLGAAALGDIGTHFPDSDERWRGADSIELLSKVAGMLVGAGFEVVNVDARAATHDGNDDAKSNNNFCCGYHHDEKDNCLAINVRHCAANSNEREVYCIEHEFDAHKHDERVATNKHTNCTN